MIRGILTTRWLILPIIITACGTAPVTTPPAGALEVEEELMLRIIDYAEGYRATKINLDIDSMITSALMEFENGSNDTLKQEELLQLPSDKDSESIRRGYDRCSDRSWIRFIQERTGKNCGCRHSREED